MWRNDPDIDDLDADYWDSMAAELRQTLDPALLKVYVNQGGILVGEIGIGVADWGRYNSLAVEWISKYNFELVKGINATTEKLIREALEVFYREGVPFDEIAEMLSAFGPVRARMIAVTEVTRASVNGELGLTNMLSEEIPGLQWVTTWQTANDAHVCPICAPMQGQEATWAIPPAHPNCRCWLNHAIRDNMTL